MAGLVPHQSIRTGRAAVIAVAAVLLAITLVTIDLTVAPSGVGVIQVLLTAVLVIFLCRGARWARILTVALCALTVFIILRLLLEGYWAPLSWVRCFFYLAAIYILVWFQPAREFFQSRARGRRNVA
jgi:cell division protein FtsW (lipid II flippase)